MNRRELLGTAVGLTMSVSPRALFAQTLEHYAAGGTPIEGDSLIFLAQSEGYFAKVGIALDVQKVSTGEVNAAGLASGDIAVGGVNTMSLAIAHQNGIDLKVIAGGVMYQSSHTGSLMMVAKTSPPTSGSGFNGKIFAVNVLHVKSRRSFPHKRGSTSRAEILKTIRWVEMPFAVMESGTSPSPAALMRKALLTQPFATTALATCRSLGSPNDATCFRGSSTKLAIA